MANRSKRVLNSAPNLEHEIERNREQEEWEKVRLFFLILFLKIICHTKTNGIAYQGTVT